MIFSYVYNYIQFIFLERSFDEAMATGDVSVGFKTLWALGRHTNLVPINFGGIGKSLFAATT